MQVCGILVTYTQSIAAPIISDVNIVYDVRAIVDPRSREIKGYVPVAIIGIDTEWSEGEKKSLTFQLDEETLATLSEDLNKAKQLLASLREKFCDKSFNM